MSLPSRVFPWVAITVAGAVDGELTSIAQPSRPAATPIARPPAGRQAWRAGGLARQCWFAGIPPGRWPPGRPTCRPTGQPSTGRTSGRPAA